MSQSCLGCANALASHTPTWGGVLDEQRPPGLLPSGREAQRRVLLALDRELSLDCCPSLPDVVALLLLVLEEVFLHNLWQVILALSSVIISRLTLRMHTQRACFRMKRLQWPNVLWTNRAKYL